MKRIEHKRCDRGFIIVIALIALLAISFFLITGVATTTSTMKVSGNYAKTVDSFNIAEVGIAKARPILEAQTFDEVLTGCAGQPKELIAETPFNTGTYNVFVADNDDGDGNLCDDADNIIRVISYGKNASGGRVQIEAHLQKPTASGTPIPFPPNPAGGAGAAMACGAKSEISAGGASSIDGRDRDAPTLPCGVGQCPLGPVIGPGGYGVVSESSTSVISGNIVSNNTPKYVKGIADTSCLAWRTLRDSLALLPYGEDVVPLPAGNYTSPLNTCDDPKVFKLNTNGTVKFSGQGEACGIFIVDAKVTVDLTGNAVLIGVILIMGDQAELSYTSGSGNPEFYGQVIVQSASVDSAKELAVGGNADIYYSTEGIGYANKAMNDALSPSGGGGGGGGLIIMSWKESY